MRIRGNGEPDFDGHALAGAAATVETVFEAFDRLAILEDVLPDSLTLVVGHVGGAKFRATLAACLARALADQDPGRYVVELLDGDLPSARIRLQRAMGVRP